MDLYGDFAGFSMTRNFDYKFFQLLRLPRNFSKTWRLSRYTLLQRIKEIYQAQLVIFKKN